MTNWLVIGAFAIGLACIVLVARLGIYAFHTQTPKTQALSKTQSGAKKDTNRDYKIGFISAGSALFGAALGAVASLIVTSMQLHASTDQESREKRAAVYADFLVLQP